MQPERIVRTMADLKKALADLEREGRTILNVGGRKVLLLPLDPTDDLTDDEYEGMLSHPVVKARLEKAVAQVDAGLGIPDKDLDDFFNGKEK